MKNVPSPIASNYTTTTLMVSLFNAHCKAQHRPEI